jgi:hypothetical protein
MELKVINTVTNSDQKVVSQYILTDNIVFIFYTTFFVTNILNTGGPRYSQDFFCKFAYSHLKK